MADITIDIPGVGSVDFPDTMKPEDINAAAKRLHDQANPAPSVARQLGKATLDTLPAIGGIVGGVLSTPESFGLGTVPGMALGTAAGQGARDLIGHATGLDAPTTPTEKAWNMTREGALAAAVPGIVEGLRTPLRTLGEGISTIGKTLNSRSLPQSLYKMGQVIPQMWEDARPYRVGEGTLTKPAWQNWPSAVESTPTESGGPLRVTTAPPAADPSVLSAAERASLEKQGINVASIEQGLKNQPIRPVASHAPTQPDLQGPRILTGAQRVGQQMGMSTEDVRQAAGPVLDEARGDASPILPKNALGDIIDALKQLPKEGPEREAYVARATSGKTKWQVENIRRTLEHLGLVAPAAAALDPVRQELMRLMSSHDSTQD